MPWLNMGEVLKVNSVKFPHKMAVKSAVRELSFMEYNERACRLANAWLGMGLKKGDRIATLLYNVIEYMEIYAAAAKAGVVIAPVNFRWVGPEIEYVVNNSESKAFMCSEEFLGEVEAVKGNFEQVGSDRFIFVGAREKTPQGYLNYEEIIAPASPEEPGVKIDPQETWILLYTSGTTGRPKGVIRSHESYIAFFLINEVDFGFKADHRPGEGDLYLPSAHSLYLDVEPPPGGEG